MVVTSILASVLGVIRAPCLGVHSTGLSNTDAVLQEKIGVEELAGLRLVVGWRVSDVVLGL